jgi:peptidoglycan/xylan/chitin deacetylase (PgdA/CDA1 family)
MLDRYRVKPIVAVVPDNMDRELQLGPPRNDFWSKVRNWKEKGWAIGVHGYQHLYVTKHSGILRLNRRSEFAGLIYDEQLRKLRRAIEIFRREQTAPDVWVAPSHSFDWNTVRVLNELGIRVISDGLSPLPHRDSTGMLWIPQQLWRFRNMPPGIWTVCFHHNHWGEAELKSFRVSIERYSSRMTSVPEVGSIYANRKKTVSDRIGAAAVFGFIHMAGYYGRLRHAYRN